MPLHAHWLFLIILIIIIIIITMIDVRLCLNIIIIITTSLVPFSSRPEEETEQIQYTCVPGLLWEKCLWFFVRVINYDTSRC